MRWPRTSWRRAATATTRTSALSAANLARHRRFEPTRRMRRSCASTRWSAAPVSLPHAIRSCTGLPAEILGWSDRGTIREGAKADIVVLDLEALHGRSSLRAPHRYSEGVDLVLVNGRTALEQWRAYWEPGRAHPRPGHRVDGLTFRKRRAAADSAVSPPLPPHRKSTYSPW